MKLIPLVLATFLLAQGLQASPQVQDGDIIFHRSQSCQSHAIAAATRSHFTHVGIIFIERGRPRVYEASCAVQSVPLDDFIRRGEGGHYVIKRLRDGGRLDVSRLKREVNRMKGRSYDSYFEWSDNRIYCSELVWKAYERACGIELGELKKLREFDLKSGVVKDTLRKRYGSRVPLDMKVIAPSDIYDSRLLTTVEADKESTLSRFANYLGKFIGRE